MQLIFIGGVHGVGKTTFCNTIKRELGFDTFTASALIAQRKQASFSSDKLTPDLATSQQYLLAAVQELCTVSPTFLLDGHFCLLDAEEQISRIPSATFVALNPTAIVLLTENPDAIAERRRRRDGIDHDITAIGRFQQEEHTYAAVIADMLSIPFNVSLGSDDLSSSLEFVGEIFRRGNNGR